MQPHPRIRYRPLRPLHPQRRYHQLDPAVLVASAAVLVASAVVLVASAAVVVASAAVVVASAAVVVASSRPRTRRSSRLRTRKRPACLTAFEKTIFW